MGRNTADRSCEEAAGNCPFINVGHASCADRLCLGRLAEAFELCAGRFDTCPTYLDLAREQPREPLRLSDHRAPSSPHHRPQPARSVVRLTLHRHPLHAPGLVASGRRGGAGTLPLRRTGT